MAQSEVYWKFKEFVLGSDGVFGTWAKGLPQADQAKVDLFIDRLRLMKTFPPKLVFKLTGYKKIYELRIKGPHVQYRPLGCYGPGRHEFTLLVGAMEVENKFDPKDAPDKAVERQLLIGDKKVTRYLWTEKEK